MYRVIKSFTDMQDNNFLYNVGDIYPRANFEVLPSRIKELSGKKNRQGEPLIEEVEAEHKGRKKAEE